MGAPFIKMTPLQEGVRIEASYLFPHDGSADISIVVPVVNPTMLEAQAIACEQAAEGLKRFAVYYRNLMGHQGNTQG